MPERPESSDPAEPAARRAASLPVASGKGGIGKTMLAVNLAAALHARGERVLLVDLDLHHPNVHIALGMRPRRGVADLLGGADPAQVVTASPAGFDVLPGRGYVHRSVPGEGLTRLLDGLSALRAGYDVVVSDHAPGLGDPLLNGLLTRVEALVVVSGVDSPSMTDAYALHKHVHHTSPDVRCGLVFNRCTIERTYQSCLARFQDAAARFLGSTVHALGWIPHSRRIARSGTGVEVVVGSEPPDPAGLAVEALAPAALDMARAERVEELAP